MRIISGTSNLGFANSIIKHLNSYGSDVKLTRCYHHNFPSGETYCQIQENIRGEDVFLVVCKGKNVNDSLMELLVMSDACRRASAKRITAVLPMFPYSRQDRKDKSRTPISSKLVFDLIQCSGINRILTMDLHAQQLQGFTNSPVDHLFFRPALINAIKDKHIDVIVAPDTGAIKKVIEFTEKCKLSYAFVVKNRQSDVDVNVVEFIGNVTNKNVLIIDDLTESAGTLIAAAEVCRNNNAKNIFVGVTHCCLTPIGNTRLKESINKNQINGFYCSNTVDTSILNDINNTNTVDVSDYFALAIKGIHDNTSITALF